MSCIVKNIKQQSGFTLLEVIIALFIFTIGILGVAAMQVRAIQGNSSGMRLTEATAQAQEMIERIIQEPYANFVVPVPPSSTTTVSGPYTVRRDIAILPGLTAFTANDALWVTVTVTWNEAGSFARSLVISCIKSQNVENSYMAL